MTKFCAGTILTSQVMDCQTRVIGKALRPLFAEPVTFENCIYFDCLLRVAMFFTYR